MPNNSLNTLRIDSAVTVQLCYVQSTHKGYPYHNSLTMPCRLCIELWEGGVAFGEL